MIDITDLQGLTPFGKYNFYNYFNYMYLEEREITESDIIDLVRFNKTFHQIFESDDPNTFVAGTLKGSYHIVPEDILEALQKLKKASSADFMEWFSSIFNASEEINEMLKPNDYKERFLGDYFFDDDDHLVVSIMNYLDNTVIEEDFPRNIEPAITFIIDVLNNRGQQINHKNYSDSTLSLVLGCISEELDDASNNEVLLTYYKSNLELLASKNNYEAIKILAYSNYAGNPAFPRDTIAAHEYFQKALRMKEDSDVYRTLGYIYYYGYHNEHRKADMQKAFRCFSTSYLMDGNHEATYKLADCYLNGYGIKRNEQVAARLVSSLYKSTLKSFKEGNFSCKLADVALRLSAFYHEGIGFTSDQKHAEHLLCIARCAIKKRLETTNYVGDKKVAISIENLAKEINLEKDIKRIIKDNGYVIDPDDELVKSLGEHNQYSIYADVDGIHIVIPRDDFDYFYNIAYSNKLNFAEVTKKVHLLFKCDYDISLVESIKNDDEFFVDIKDGTLYLSKPAEDILYTCDIDEIIYFPTSLKQLSNVYTTVEVEFETNGKLYEYLYEGKEEVKVGDSLYVNTPTKPKRVVVISVSKKYEDQLAIPLKLISKAYPMK